MISPKHVLGDPFACKEYTGLTSTWVPVVLESFTPEDDYKWEDDRLGKDRKHVEAPSWANSQPNGKGSEKCMSMVQDASMSKWIDALCSEPRCFFCSMPIVQTYYLRGSDIHFSFDHDHYLSLFLQNNASEIIFEGQGHSRVAWYPLLQTTEIQDLQNGTVHKVFKKNPFGSLQSGRPSEMKVFTNVSFEYYLCCFCIP